MGRSSTSVTVRLVPEVADALRRAWHQSHGAEPCGCLFGTQPDAASWEVTGFVQGHNVHASPASHWALDPEWILHVSSAHSDGARTWIGYWHGHLVGPPEPSRADRAGVAPLGPALHVISGAGGAKGPVLRAWIAQDGRFLPADLEEVPAPGA